MTRTLAALVLVVALALPGTASAESAAWEAIKDEWSRRPWSLFLAAPALLVTAPFILVKELIDKIGEEDDE